jgi:hypothetical protein
MSGVNGNVIMSGWEDENPDDERREADSGNAKSVSRRANDGRAAIKPRNISRKDAKAAKLGEER